MHVHEHHLIENGGTVCNSKVVAVLETARLRTVCSNASSLQSDAATRRPMRMVCALAEEHGCAVGSLSSSAALRWGELLQSAASHGAGRSQLRARLQGLCTCARAASKQAWHTHALRVCISRIMITTVTVEVICGQRTSIQ